MPRILIIEDDTDINNAICAYLTRQGCRCRQAFSGTEGRLYWQQEGADLIVADLMLPGLDGQALVKEIRAGTAAPVPIIVLSARTAVEDRLELLKLGADDYMTKPFSLEELWLRIGVQLRHAGACAQQGQANCIRYKDWVIDPQSRTLTAVGVPVELTLHEFEIAALLAARPQKVFTRQEIFESVWNQQYFVEDKTINVHISNLRAKLRPTGTDGYIKTVWGIGFKCGD